MIYLIATYLVGIVTMFALFAWRNVDDNIRVLFVLSVIWPVSIILAIVIIIVDYFRIDIRIADGHNGEMFGWRKPGNPDVRGFALTLFGTEFQFVKGK